MSQHSVLIIEDESFIRESLAEFFIDEGFEVETTERGEDAFVLLENRTFDAYIVDIRLSGMDGTRAILRIKELDPRSHIFVFTGSLEFQITSDLAKLGLTEEHVIYKPVDDLSIISDKIRKALEEEY